MTLTTLNIHSLLNVDPEVAKEGLVLLLDKPIGWTSFDVVNKTRYLLRKRLHLKKLKVGHAGTLDPMASGLLIICTGKYTTHLQNFQDLGKVYSGTIILGGITASYDKETPVECVRPWQHLTTEIINLHAKEFVGEIQQVPPGFSAIKIDGQRAYIQARKGHEVVIPSRTITISSFEIDTSSLPDIAFSVACSKGTYIRSIAHDLGQSLGCGGYLGALQRDAIGDYKLLDAMSIEQLSIWAKPFDEVTPVEE